jgi:hypothetical protein
LGVVAQASPGPALAGQMGGYWEDDETDQKLKEADSRVLELQRSRFRALFGSDKKEAERLNKEFRKAQKERRGLLRATGRQ